MRGKKLAEIYYTTANTIYKYPHVFKLKEKFLLYDILVKLRVYLYTRLKKNRKKKEKKREKNRGKLFTEYMIHTRNLAQLYLGKNAVLFSLYISGHIKKEYEEKKIEEKVDRRKKIKTRSCTH